MLGKDHSLLFRSRCSRLMIFLFGQRKFSHFLLKNAIAENGEEGNTFLLVIRCARHAVQQLQRLLAAHGLGLLLLCCWWGRRRWRPGHCFVWYYEWISFGVFLLIPPRIRWQLQKYHHNKTYIRSCVLHVPWLLCIPCICFQRKQNLWAADSNHKLHFMSQHTASTLYTKLWFLPTLPVIVNVVCQGLRSLDGSKVLK